ncbi:PREDICTED: gibberellin 2-beta-dioxygenase 8 [Theobroma cacao]|uniref:Gibberellin 2-beta-dioxygenase 8 n=1 Tax=Theobroma cacao TaxID=3641 RepID=A0AB32WTH5_THECC|nr:PREDICTED: gibberellin 2-beta-dioxygenase 8 [Theobroma cacao]
MDTGSYPPLFSQRNNPNQNVDLDESIQDVEGLDPIPHIDLQYLDLDKLGEACKDWGLFRLVNHGIPSELLLRIQDQARELFALSFEYKQAILRSPLSYFWGTTARTTSGGILRSSKSISWVEVINFPLSQLPQFQVEDSLLDSFRYLLDEYGRHQARLARTLFEGMAKSLNLDPRLSKSYISEATGFIRVHRYPRISEGSQAWGVGVHTDSSILSILNQDQLGGLEAFRENRWFPIKPIANSLIINLGDMMQAISNDKYVSVKHRVRVNKQVDRISINYFVFPELDCTIQSSNYKPFTYKDFHAQGQTDIETLGYKVGLEDFKLNRDI